MGDRFEDFVPEIARAEALLAPIGRERLVDSERCLLLAVSGCAVVRKTWTDRVEVGARLFAELRAAPEPTASLEAQTVRTQRVLDAASRRARKRACTGCPPDEHEVICTVCSGAGRVSAGDEWIDCRHCGGKRKVVCPTCDGTGISRDVSLHYLEDRVTSVAHVFVPDVAHALAAPLVGFMRGRTRVPECLSFDPSAEHGTTDAYRGRSREAEYRGHRLGQALDRARRYLALLQKAPSIPALSYGVCGWPFAFLQARDGPSVALAVDESGELVLIEAS